MHRYPFILSLTLSVGLQHTALAAPESMLTPPPGNAPVIVRASFHLRDINEINDEAETFQFGGVLVLTWKDSRQAFDPAEAGVAEKIYQGDFQFDELSPAWFPQLVLTNESGLFETDAVILRIRPDGTSTLISTLDAIAKTSLDMRRFPFDSQRLEAVFDLIGFDQSEVALEAGPAIADEEIRISQWEITGIETSVRQRTSIASGNGNFRSSTFVVTVTAERNSLFILRLIALPLAMIVGLSWSVFWMERSSLGDRISVSFVGILTAVAYQIVVDDLLPHVSYITLLHGFIDISFFVMCATVVVNLVVGACDKKGKSQLGDTIDHRCRWIFPVAYTVLIATLACVIFLFLSPG